MAKIKVNDPCPCGSGMKFKKCCKVRDITWKQNENGDFYRVIPVEGRLEQVVEQLDDDIYRHFERDRLPDDPFMAHSFMYSDRDAERKIVEIMKKVGTNPAFVYAFKKTGILLTEEMEARAPLSVIDEWDNAVDEYYDFGGDPEEGSEDRQFESKLRHLVGDIDSLIYLFGIIVQKYFNESYPDDSAPEGAEILSPVAYMGLNLARSQRALRSIKYLIEEDYDEDALKLVRGLYENYLHIILVKHKPDSIISLVDAKYGMRDGSFKYFEKNGKEDSRKVVCCANGRIYPSSISGYKMAESSNREFDVEFYDIFYQRASDVVHPSVFNIRDYIRADKLSPLDSDWKEEAVIYSIFVGCLIGREIMTINHLPVSLLEDCKTVIRRLLDHLIGVLKFLKMWSDRIGIEQSELEIVHKRSNEILSSLGEKN
ncbi:MAG: SEC-C domain-containing protein [Pseudomonadota bacterium]|nr:SEC-C domain-containing protein [Pseudomonadota bacterium]